MLCASIILPMTPPELFAAAISTGLTPTCCAVTTCNPPKSTLDDVSDPVSATPSQPSKVPKNGYSTPACAKARPRMLSVPEYLVTYPSASIAEIVSREGPMRFNVARYARAISGGRQPISSPASSAVRAIPEPDALSQLNRKTAPSAFGAATTGATRSTCSCSPGILKAGAEMLLSHPFTCGVPQAKTTTLSSAHGAHARSTTPRGADSRAAAIGLALAPAPP